MVTSLEDLQEAIGGHDEEKQVTNQNRNDWNLYVKYLQKRGIAGKPELDKNALGKNLLATYIKENPTTSLTTDLVIPIQKDFANYRQWSIDQLRDRKAQLTDAKSPDGRWVTPDEDLSEYMKELSIVDNYPGSRTTSHSFPLAYMKTFVDGKLQGVESQGLINTANPVTPK